jgi:serine phosphatase RsbU (regulator of sigma subunit)
MITGVVVVAVVLTVLCYQTGKRNANDLAAQNARQIHQRIEEHLDRLMDLPPAINQLNAARLREGLLSLDDPARSRKLTFQTLSIFPAVSSIVLGSATGRVMWEIRYPGETSYEYAQKIESDGEMKEFSLGSDGQIGAKALRAYQFDPGIRPWYRAAIAADAPTWGDVYVWVRGGKAVTLGVPYVEPVRDAKGQLQGVICCELTLADISSFLQQLQIGKTGVAFIVEHNGDLVATSTGVDCMKEDMSRVSAIKSPDERIVESIRQLASPSGSLAPVNSVRVEHAEIRGEPSQVVVSEYRNRRNLDWFVVTVVPDADFLGEVQRNRDRSMVISALAVAISLLIGIATAFWFLRPILAIVAHARQVGAGDFDARIHRTENREMAQLSSALNEMSRGLQDRMKLRHALDLAMEVQQSLLPAETPRVIGLDIAARSKYCDQTGGDYYDYLAVEGMSPDSLMIALGDVTGHGIAAAMLMATARGVLRSQVKSEGSLGKLLTHVNQLFCADTSGDRFMTMFLAIIDTGTMSMRWASAGHDHPLIYDPDSGLLTELDSEGGGMPLGVRAAEEYDELTFTGLRAGQVMLIGTDGLWEAQNKSGELFGKTRVGEVLAASRHLSAAQIDAAIYDGLQAFCGSGSHDDDITYVVLKLIK